MNKVEMKKYKLKDIGKIVTGKTPSTSNQHYFNGAIPFITPEDIAKGYCVIDTARHISIDGYNSIKSNTLDSFSILVGCIGSDMGNVAFSNQKCATNQQINAITDINEQIDGMYLYYLLSTKKEQFKQLAGSTTTPILPKSVFETIEYNIPHSPSSAKSLPSSLSSTTKSPSTSGSTTSSKQWPNSSMTIGSCSSTFPMKTAVPINPPAAKWSGMKR